MNNYTTWPGQQTGVSYIRYGWSQTWASIWFTVSVWYILISEPMGFYNKYIYAHLSIKTNVTQGVVNYILRFLPQGTAAPGWLLWESLPHRQGNTQCGRRRHSCRCSPTSRWKLRPAVSTHAGTGSSSLPLEQTMKGILKQYNFTLTISSQ